MEENNYDLRKARHSFSLVGFSFAALLLTAILGQLLIAFLSAWLRGGGSEVGQSSWWKWLVSFAPMYLMAFPACYLLIRKLPARAPEKQPITKKEFLMLIPMCFCLTYAGNLVGTTLSMLLSRGQAENALNDYAMDQSFLKILVMVVLAPTLEELICRKIMLDRTRRFGEKNAVLLSGLIFGLLHQNLFQFFYAFALGCVFAYIYIRTGCLRYCVILHMIVNFMGSVVAPLIVSQVDLSFLTDGLMSGEGAALGGLINLDGFLEALPGYLLLMAYSTAYMGVCIFGLVLILRKRRSLTWKETTEQLPKGTAFKTTWGNVGMILYTVLCIAMIVLALM